VGWTPSTMFTTVVLSFTVSCRCYDMSHSIVTTAEGNDVPLSLNLCSFSSIQQIIAEWLACCSQAEKEHGFKSQSQRCRVTVLGKLFTPIVPLFTKQQNWYQPA